MTPAAADLPPCDARRVSDEGSWFFEEAGATVGPVPFATLIAHLRSGRLGVSSRVWTAAMDRRLAIGQVPALAPYLPTDHGVSLLVPSGPQSATAIAAGYAGLLVFPGPLAVALGVLALRDLGRYPHKGGKGRAWTGIIGGLIGCCAWALALT